MFILPQLCVYFKKIKDLIQRSESIYLTLSWNWGTLTAVSCGALRDVKKFGVVRDAAKHPAAHRTAPQKE